MAAVVCGKTPFPPPSPSHPTPQTLWSQGTTLPFSPFAGAPCLAHPRALLYRAVGWVGGFLATHELGLSSPQSLSSPELPAIRAGEELVAWPGWGDLAAQVPHRKSEEGSGAPD